MKRTSFSGFFIFFTLLSHANIFAQESLTIKPVAAIPDLKKVFLASPIIYTILFALSLTACVIWFYSIITLRDSDRAPQVFLKQVKQQILERRFEAALMKCRQESNFTANIIACGIHARNHGPQITMDAMQAEGKRFGTTLWHRLSLLNDIAIVAPMLGLLGTVTGMFYAFYDINRTAESITAIFDGLGIAIGTTVAGLIVAIIAMIFHSTLKYRIVRLLNNIENEALALGRLIHTKAALSTT